MPRCEEGQKGCKLTAGIFTHVPQPLPGSTAADKALKLSMAFFRIIPLIPVAQDSASSCGLRLWLTSRA